ERGVISFSTISYLSALVIMTMFGFAQGIQPILSFSYGKKSKSEILHIFDVSIFSIMSLGIFFLFLACFFSKNLVKYFLSTETETLFAAIALKKYSPSYLFMGLNILFSAFFTALKKARFSLIITFCRGIVFPIVALFLCTRSLGSEIIWFAAFYSEAMTFLISFYIYQRYKKELLND
ncbi:MATE family efflux transporter, partial [Fusobacterium necrophorum]|nr:MATE family efflux transporter [Fusobacterium necrophorum]